MGTVEYHQCQRFCFFCFWRLGIRADSYLTISPRPRHVDPCRPSSLRLHLKTFKKYEPQDVMEIFFLLDLETSPRVIRKVSQDVDDPDSP